MVGNLRDAVRAIGEDVLNIKAEEIGTHSIRSGLHILAGILRIPVFSIPIACFSQES